MKDEPLDIPLQEALDLKEKLYAAASRYLLALSEMLAIRAIELAHHRHGKRALVQENDVEDVVEEWFANSPNGARSVLAVLRHSKYDIEKGILIDEVCLRIEEAHQLDQPAELPSNYL